MIELRHRGTGAVLLTADARPGERLDVHEADLRFADLRGALADPALARRAAGAGPASRAEAGPLGGPRPGTLRSAPLHSGHLFPPRPATQIRLPGTGLDIRAFLSRENDVTRPEGGSRMRVLMLGWEFPPHQAGGLATATHGLVRGLLARGLAITLVVPFAATGTSLEGLRVVSTAGPRTLFRKVRVPSPLLPYARPGEYTRTLARTFPGTGPSGIYGRDLFAEVERFAAAVAQIAAREPHDVIDAHDWMTYAAGLLARRASGRPLVAHVHATEFDRSGESVNPAIEARERLGMEVADLVIANSFRLKRQVVDRYGVPQRKVAVVHWGIDEDRPEYHLTPPAPFRPRSPLVLFLGRVTRQKGPDHFLAAARRVAQILPETRFVIAGSGDLLPGLLERSVEWGIADRVHFAGGLDGPDVYRALRMADLCVMPSVSEPFGLVALESLKSGTPCLIPRDSGVAEVVRHAIRIEFWDVEDMADKIVAVLRHTELHTELREAALAETGAPAFGLDEPARRTEEAYRRALAWSPTGTLG